MRTIKLTFPNNYVFETESAIRPLLLLDHFDVDDNKIIAIKVNNEICSLDAPIGISAKLEPASFLLDDVNRTDIPLPLAEQLSCHFA